MTKLLYTPTASAIRNSHLYRYMRWLEDERLFVFSATDEALRYGELQRWSAASIEDFWESLWRYFEILHDGAYERVLQGERMPFFRWFEGTRLNYAEHIFRMADPLRPALIFKSEMHDAEEISWAQLRGDVAALAAFFREKGVGAGDRVAAFLPNTPHAVAAALAAMSIGAVWSSCSPDFGVNSVVERFGQIEPKVLIAADGYMYGGKRFDRRDTVRALRAQLPTVQSVVWIPYLDTESKPEGIPGGVLWSEALAGRSDELRFERVPFSHPIWVLYSSGTTGAPKAITHSHGGNLLEHLKYLHFHNDVHRGERFFLVLDYGLDDVEFCRRRSAVRRDGCAVRRQPGLAGYGGFVASGRTNPDHAFWHGSAVCRGLHEGGAAARRAFGPERHAQFRLYRIAFAAGRLRMDIPRPEVRLVAGFHVGRHRRVYGVGRRKPAASRVGG